MTALADAVHAHLVALGDVAHRPAAGGGCWPECVACTAEALAAALRDVLPGIPLGRYVLDLALPRPPKTLTANGARRAHPMAAARDIRRICTLVATLGKAAGIPECDHLVVSLEWAPGTRHKRDEDNLWPLLKACCDGLARGPRKDWIGLALVPDDTRQYMTKLAPRILTPDDTSDRGMWLTVEAYAAHPPVMPAVGLFEATS